MLSTGDALTRGWWGGEDGRRMTHFEGEGSMDVVEFSEFGFFSFYGMHRQSKTRKILNF